MKRFINSIHFFCIAFTFVTLTICAANFLMGYPVSVSGETITVNSIIIIGLLCADRLIELLNMKNRTVRQIVDFAVKYAVVITACSFLYLHCQLPIAENQFTTSFVFTVVYAASYMYYRKKAQINAEEINRLLDKYHSK